MAKDKAPKEPKAEAPKAEKPKAEKSTKTWKVNLYNRHFGRVNEGDIATPAQLKHLKDPSKYAS